MERERTISVKKVMIHLADPQSPELRFFGPFLNQEVAERHLEANGWTKVCDKLFVDDVSKDKDLQQVCAIEESLEHVENVPRLIGNHLVYSEKGISIQ